MISGFEEITYELTDYEKVKLLPCLVAGFSQMVGKNKVFSNKQICDKLISVGYEINDARLRKLIHHIRTKNLVPGLIGTSKGYYKATTKAELEEYLISLRERKRSIEEIITALEHDLQSFS